MSAAAPFLTAWFRIMDSDEPSRILDLISEDFSFSIVFSVDGAATDFRGGRDAMVQYLEQRERGTRTHHALAATSDGAQEFYLGEVRRGGGEVEASFVATGRLDASGRLCRFLIGRSSEVRFS